MRRKSAKIVMFLSICILFLCQTALAFPLFYPKLDFPAGDGPFSLAIGDLDGDRVPDLAVANVDSDNVSVLLGNGDGTFQSAVDYSAGNSPYSVAIGKLNADEYQDLAVANGNSDNVSVLLGNGDGTFQSAVNYSAGDMPVTVAIGDLDGDGALDLAVGSLFSDNVSVLINTSPVPDIKANGSDGPVVVASGENVNITLSLDPEIYAGELGDWWGILISSYGMFPLFTFQAPLFELPEIPVLDTPLPPGWFVFVFNIEDTPDGAFQLGWYDYVVVLVTAP